MTPHLLMQKIRLPETAQKLFLDQIPNDLLPWRTLLHTDTNALCEKLTPQTAPAVLIALAADAYDDWMSKGISEEVLFKEKPTRIMRASQASFEGKLSFHANGLFQ